MVGEQSRKGITILTLLLETNPRPVHDPTVRTLFRRCVQCPPEAPVCKECASDEVCQLISQSCNACASTTCVKIGQLPGQLVDEPKTPIGPIVGGVIGGVIAIAAATFLVWWFCIRPKRKAALAWDPPEKRDQSTLSRSARQSAAQSIASTVLSRASNVIPIAYIPGVTVRSPPESPGIPPPMPAFPTSSASTPAVEQHFFMPHDLRASTWSDTSSIADPRISLAPSLARTTFYANDDDIPPVPAQQAMRIQANVVNVKSGATTPSMNGRTPPIPQVPTLGSSNSSIVAKNVMARPIEIKKSSSGPRVPTLGNLAKQSASKRTESTTSSEKSVPVFFDEKEVVVGSPESAETSPLVKPKPSFATFSSARSSSVSAILPADGPLAGNSTTTHRHSKSEGLNAMIEEAINRARNPHVSVRPDSKKSSDQSPFSDINEIKENE
jgi:protein OPY2